MSACTSIPRILVGRRGGHQLERQKNVGRRNPYGGASVGSRRRESEKEGEILAGLPTGEKMTMMSCKWGHRRKGGKGRRRRGVCRMRTGGRETSRTRLVGGGGGGSSVVIAFPSSFVGWGDRHPFLLFPRPRLIFRDVTSPDEKKRKRVGKGTERVFLLLLPSPPFSPGKRDNPGEVVFPSSYLLPSLLPFYTLLDKSNAGDAERRRSVRGHLRGSRRPPSGGSRVRRKMILSLFLLLLRSTTLKQLLLLHVRMILGCRFPVSLPGRREKVMRWRRSTVHKRRDAKHVV